MNLARPAWVRSGAWRRVGLLGLAALGLAAIVQAAAPADEGRAQANWAPVHADAAAASAKVAPMPANGLSVLAGKAPVQAGGAQVQPERTPIQANEASVPFELAEIAPGVWLHTGQIGDFSAENGGDIANLGFVIGSRCVAVIDTGGSRKVGARLQSAIQAHTRLPVCYVIATHMHPDHLLGHAAFEDGHPAFVAATRQIPALAARAAGYLQRQQSILGALADGSRIVPPDHPVASTEVLDLGGRSLALRTWRTAHTDNDLTVQDSATGTLFAGDLLFRRHLPVIDGSLRGWLAVLPDLRASVKGPLVPGHGPVYFPQVGADPADSPIELERVYLDSVAHEVRAALAAHKTLQQTVAETQPPPDWLLTELYHRRNVTAAYAELEWED